MNYDRILIIDTETTGLPQSRLSPITLQPHVIEYCGIVWTSSADDWDEEYSTLIRPPIPIPEKITQITGLADSDVADAPFFRDVEDRIKKQIEEADAVIAHNVTFDKRMLNFEFERRSSKVNWPKTICTVERTVHIQGKRLRLADLYKLLFNEPMPKAHRAKDDVIALFRVCKELKERGKLAL